VCGDLFMFIKDGTSAITAAVYIGNFDIAELLLNAKVLAFSSSFVSRIKSST
jgi:hypothetical protein